MATVNRNGQQITSDWKVVRNPMAGAAPGAKYIAFNPNDPSQQYRFDSPDNQLFESLDNGFQIGHDQLGNYFDQSLAGSNKAYTALFQQTSSAEKQLQQQQSDEALAKLNAGQITPQQATQQADQAFSSSPELGYNAAFDAQRDSQRERASTSGGPGIESVVINGKTVKVGSKAYYEAQSQQTTQSPQSQLGDVASALQTIKKAKDAGMAVTSSTSAKDAEAYLNSGTRHPGESIADYTSRINQGQSSGTTVGTSFAERRKELEKELGVGEAPTAPDLFTAADQERLNVARQERTSIEDELAQILDERLQLDDEFTKFKNYQKGLPEAGRIGAISEEERNLQDRLNVLNRRELVAETKLRNRNTVISELSGLQQQEYTDSVQQYEREYSKAIQLYNIFDAEQDELKTNAKANLDVYSNAIAAQIQAGKATGVTPVQQQKLTEMEMQAGLPIGSTMAVLQTLKPNEEKLYSGVDDNGNFQYVYQKPDGSIGVRTATGVEVPKSSGTTSPSFTSTEEKKLLGVGFSPSEIAQIEQDVADPSIGIKGVLSAIDDASQRQAVADVYGAEEILANVEEENTPETEAWWSKAWGAVKNYF